MKRLVRLRKPCASKMEVQRDEENEEFSENIKNYPEMSFTTNQKKILLLVKPNKGYWRESIFEFKILRVNKNENKMKFQLKCLTVPIFHPNIKFDGSICFHEEPQCVATLLKHINDLFHSETYSCCNHQLILRDEKSFSSYKYFFPNNCS